MKKILKNSVYAVCIILYFVVLGFAYTRMNIDRLSEDIKVFAGMFLVLGLISLEKAYKKDDGKTAIVGIELLVLSFHSLSIMHMTSLLKCEFIPYILASAAVIVIYYILKIIVLYTKQRREYLKDLSDISEIVKKDEPIKKEAKKRSELKVEVREDKKKEEKETNKNNSKKKTSTKRNQNKEKNEKEEVKTKKKTTSKSNKPKKTESKNKPKEKTESKTAKTTKAKKNTTTKKKTTKKEVSKND